MTKFIENRIVLAIYPYSRGFGYAIMANPRKMLESRVIRINPFNYFTVKHRIKRSIIKHKPCVVIIQEPERNEFKLGRRVKKICQEINYIALKNKLPIYQYTRDQVREVFIQLGAKTKFEISNLLVQEFTELKHQLPKKRGIYDSESYNQPMFDALSLAMTYYWVEG